jgi:hypothetical protein
VTVLAIRLQFPESDVYSSQTEREGKKKEKARETPESKFAIASVCALPGPPSARYGHGLGRTCSPN